MSINTEEDDFSLNIEINVVYYFNKYKIQFLE